MVKTMTSIIQSTTRMKVILLNYKNRPNKNENGQLQYLTGITITTTTTTTTIATSSTAS